MGEGFTSRMSPSSRLALSRTHGDSGTCSTSGCERRREIPAGLYGAALVLLLAPAGFGLQLALGKTIWTPGLFAIGFPMALGGYYLAWKYIVARFNDVLGIG